jgi:hypothetical protein
VSLPLLGCNPTLYFNPSFLNQATGEVFPLAPGDRSDFIMIRVNNTTTVPIEFLITAERRVESDAGSDVFPVESESYRLLTQPSQQANDLGILLDCPVYRIGLGENLDRPFTEPGLFVGATAVGAGGFGIPGNVNPLNSESGNFDCGDTIVFQASEAVGTAGGVVASTFVLDDEELPDQSIFLDTFVNARSFLEESRVPEE